MTETYEDLRRELAKAEHRRIHDYIEKFVGSVEYAAALYPECYAASDLSEKGGQDES
jgi:hypothetical protein